MAFQLTVHRANEVMLRARAFHAQVDLEVGARRQRFARRDVFALSLTASADVSRVGPTFAQMYRSLPPSLGNPARTPSQRALWLVGLVLGVIGFVLLPLVRNGIGFVFLVAAAVIAGLQSISYFRWRRNS